MCNMPLLLIKRDGKLIVIHRPPESPRFFQNSRGNRFSILL